MEQVLTIRNDTESYTEFDVLQEIKECVKLLVALGIEGVAENTYSVSFRNYTTKFGACHRDRYNKRFFTIKLNKLMLDNCNSEQVHNTIMHEVIHSVDGCFNHQDKWKRIADLVNRNYVYSPISRVGRDTDLTNAINQYSLEKGYYKITCDKCGSSWTRRKKSAIVKGCQNGTCKCACGSQKFTVDFIQEI